MREAAGTDDSIGTFGLDDLVRWAADGSARRSFADALHAATRNRFLRVTIGPSHGRDVERGLSLADVDTALRLASTPPADLADLDAKRLVLRGAAATPSSGLVEAMIRAALDHDGRRLALERLRGGARTAGIGRSPPRSRRRSTAEERSAGSPRDPTRAR